ncbi:MAG TPA: glycoside hydrolase family 27 protein [bacterium]
MKAWKFIFIAVLFVGFSTITQSKEKAPLAPTPPMGWNSWDCYGPSVTEAEVKAQADYMAANLASYGWTTIVVDIQWYEPQAGPHGYRMNAELVMDTYGRLLPAPNRFPSAADGKGFKPLADYVHKKGLKFGLHIVRGIPRQATLQNTPIHKSRYRARDVADTTRLCAWLDDMVGLDTAKPGAQDYYDSILSLYARWGADFIKADDMSSPYHTGEIEALHRAIQKCGRPIVLSLSPGPAPFDRADHLKANAQLWRISNDFWDRWQDLRDQFDLCRDWTAHAGPGHWPDADMLPLGRIGIRAERGDDRQTRFTRDEQVTLMSLWSIFRSPLMMGGDLPSSDAFTLSLLTNEEVLAVNQNSENNRELFRRGNAVVWAADVPDSKSKIIALFNVGDEQPETVSISWSELGLSGPCKVRDLWLKKDLGVLEGGLELALPVHSSKMLKVSPNP